MAEQNWWAWSIWFIWFVSFNQTIQMNGAKQMNPPHQPHSTILLQDAFGLNTKQGLLHGTDVQPDWRRRGGGGGTAVTVSVTGTMIEEAPMALSVILSL